MPEKVPEERMQRGLSSSQVILVARAIFVVIALALILDAIKTAQVLRVYDVDFGTLMWFVCVLKIVSSGLAILCIILMGMNWAWSVWIWACAVLGIAVAGVSIGLNADFLFRWDVALPWAVLLIAAVLRSRFASPWKHAA